MTKTSPTPLQTSFEGRRGDVFWRMVRFGLLTILTLGLYRFWMKTRLRRWYWSATRPAGIPLEYVGDPTEKLLGFLIAVVIMAFYIGVVNLLLMFASLSLLSSNFAAYAVSLVGVIPIWFFARYRARRYVLARTRWCGMRFGLDPGAWRYAWLAMRRWSAAILTLGLLWPRMTFDLEKYRTDRTWFGDVQLHQNGTWRMLWPAFGHVVIGAIATLGMVVFASLWMPGMLWGLCVTIPWLIWGMVYYQVHATRLMANAKQARGLGLTASPRTEQVARIYGFGYLAISILVLLPLIPISILFAATQGQQAADMAGSLSVLDWALLIAGGALYFMIFVAWSALRHAFVTLPLWRHYAETLEITGAQALLQVHQRDRDEFTEAEGFAEALDLGAAI